LSAAYGGSVDKVFSHAIQGFSAEMSPKAAEAMSNDPSVLLIEEDSYVSINTTQNNAPWGLDRVDQRNVPLNTSYNYVRTGAGVHVYVIDTGIRASHTEFSGRATADFDSVYDGQNGNDCHGHGTHVAGTIGGEHYGVAKDVRLHGIRVLGCNGIGSVASTVEGIDWVTANHISPAVANMSMGSAASVLMDFAVQASIDAGVTYVVAAGNANTSACQYSPARLPAAITVGATDQNDARASFSNYGSCVDLSAPGVGIMSAWSWNDTATLNSNGTSMATPHVTGTVALYLEQNQNASPSQATAALIGDATSGQMTGDTGGSPNMILFTAPAGPTAGGAFVAGSVIDSEGRALKNVRVTLLNADGSGMRTALTNLFGFYHFEEVEVGNLYILSIQSKRYTFENSPLVFTLGENYTATSFVGIPR
jgi:subtilisin family serine protease